MVCRCRDGCGWYTLPLPHHHPDFGRTFRCGCKADEDAQAFLAQLRQDRGRFASADFASFDVDRELPEPQTWRNGTFDTTTGVWGDITASVAEQRLMLRATKGTLMRWTKAPLGWLWLQGNYGGGKTHLGAAACNALARQGRRTYYDTVPRLIKLLRDGIKDHSVDERLEKLITADVVMLDDLGMGQISAWGEGQLVDLMNERYQAELPTIITSNIPITAFSGAAISRCLEMCAVVTLVAFDIRRLLALRRQAGGA